MTEVKGWHVLSIFALAFGVIISVNLTLAFNAVRTFPGLEVKNSYVASQSFDKNRDDQLALGWEVAARLDGGDLVLDIRKDGEAVQPVIEEAIFGRATMISADQTPAFTFDGGVFRAPVDAGGGNWNLRLRARTDDGTVFQQRIVVQVTP